MYKKILFLFIISLLLAGAARADSESASVVIDSAERTIAEMLEMGFGVAYANDTLNEAKILFSQGHYLGAESLASKVLEIKEKAIAVNDLINIVESRMYEVQSKGYNISEASVLFDSGIEEFGVDNYIDAEKFMNDALNKLDEIEAEESLETTREGNGMDFLPILLDNLWIIIAVFLLALIAGMKIDEKINE